VLRKKKEYDNARGDIRKVIQGEIERTFREIDRLNGRISIISSCIEKINITSAKVEELAAARTQGVTEEQLDDIAIDLQAVFEELEISDKATADLVKTVYKPLKTDEINIESRLSNIETQHKTVSELSPDTQKRLEELEEE